MDLNGKKVVVTGGVSGLGRSMVDQARSALSDVDVFLYVADASKMPNEEDKEIAKLLKPVTQNTDESARIPLVLCMNKMDLLRADQVVDHVEAYCKLLRRSKQQCRVSTVLKRSSSYMASRHKW